MALWKRFMYEFLRIHDDNAIKKGGKNKLLGYSNILFQKDYPKEVINKAEMFYKHDVFSMI